MKINLFGKKKTSKEGKKFYTYFTKLTKKNGEELTVEVKFREEAGKPKELPCVVEFDKKNANYSEKNETYFDEESAEDKEVTRRTLWVNKFKESEYVDTSLDDFNM